MAQRVGERGDESRMMSTYVGVVLCQVGVTIALWWFGRVFSH